MQAVETPKMGIWMTTALVVGGMIGAGIVLLPVSLAPLGYNAVIGWFVSGIGALCLAYALAIISRQDGQGIQAYIERLLGPTVGFAVTWAFWVTVWVSSAAMALASASAVSLVMPGIGTDRAVAVLALAMVVFLVGINALGARATGRTAIVTVLIKITPLLAVIVIVLIRGGGERSFEAIAPLPVNFDNIATASALTLFALLGFETATAPVDKVRNPARTIPLAIIVGTAFVALLYLCSTTALSLVLPVGEVVISRAPFATAVGSYWGADAAMLAALAMAVSAFGALNGGIMIAGELGYSMALRKDLPALFARANKRGTPIVSQLIAAALTIALILANLSRDTAGFFTFLILLATSATLWLYLAGAIAALRLRPGPASVAAIAVGILFVGFAFYGSGAEANLWGIVLLAIGLALRWLMRRTRGSSPAAAANPAAPRGS
ncbi:MAG: amino acid permease [Pseudomonadota bacterium]|nr:amino acid permease [Pseudomonadota bacterium]